MKSSPCSSSGHTVVPVPQSVQSRQGRFELTPSISVTVAGDEGGRVGRALRRLLRRWEERTGKPFARDPQGNHLSGKRGTAQLVLRCFRAIASVPELGQDESYRLRVEPRRVALQARTDLGLLRGLATLEQWLCEDVHGWHLPCVEIEDRPRFPWRGLLLDVCRHWQPVDAIKRQLDAMALVKMNVLHLHLTEDQGFRIESRCFPRLHGKGSDGDFLPQSDVAELVDYAAERGIRIVPEFDIPGHVTSWLVGHPELGSVPGPYDIRRVWGVAEAALDASSDKVLAFLERFLGEMAALFPDRYVHIGGDEVKAAQWVANPRIQRFIKRQGLGDNRGLQAWFNRRIADVLRRSGKEMVGWDEVLHPGLPRDAVVQSWRGFGGVADAVKGGFSALLSNGYYLDLCWPAWRHYQFDPLPVGASLSPRQQKKILGGEAAMWTEWVTPERLDGCVWPRAAVVAERLWSSRDVADPNDLYRRLEPLGGRLEENGLLHEKNREAMLRRFVGSAGTRALAALRSVADVCEPVKNYGRNAAQPDATQFTPLTGFVDLLRVESDTARKFGDLVERVLFADAPADRASLRDLRVQLDAWQKDAVAIPTVLADSSRLAEVVGIAGALKIAAAVGCEAVDRLLSGGASEPWRRRQLARIESATKPRGAAEVALGRALRLLVAAAAACRLCRTLAHSEWKKQVIEAANLDAPVQSPHFEQLL